MYYHTEGATEATFFAAGIKRDITCCELSSESTPAEAGRNLIECVVSSFRKSGIMEIQSEFEMNISR